jgi:hypothetical protein
MPLFPTESQEILVLRPAWCYNPVISSGASRLVGSPVPKSPMCLTPFRVTASRIPSNVLLSEGQ